jgi:hypothetical protein
LKLKWLKRKEAHLINLPTLMEKRVILPETTLGKGTQFIPTLTNTLGTTLMANELGKENTSMLTVIDMRELF